MVIKNHKNFLDKWQDYVNVLDNRSTLIVCTLFVVVLVFGFAGIDTKGIFKISL
jgi:hypothetical protein